MSLTVLGSNGGGGGYNLESSLRFRSSASAYLSWTPASASNRKTWTWSGWVKLGNLKQDNYFFGCNVATNTTSSLYFGFNAGGGNGELSILSWGYFWRKTTQVFRDPSAWYHIVITVNTTLATANDRIKLYVNGEQVTSFSTINNPAQNADMGVNQAGDHIIGNYTTPGGAFFDGYMTEVNFVDGQALTPSDFGETNDNGVWSPKAYTGTYGTNGFYLNFSDGTSTTTLGYDYSGNSNNWTTNNVSLTAGATYDLMSDVPTLTDEDTANFATLNPLDTTTTSTPSFANLRTIYTSGVASRKSSIVMTTGKWYTEWDITGSGGGGGNFVIQTVGVVASTATSNSPTVSGVGYYSHGDGTNSYKFVSGVSSLYGTFWGNAGTYNLGAALDLDAGTITFYLNGVSQGAITLPANTSGWVFVNSSGTGTGTCTVDNNFGQRPFKYTPPTGYKKLNTFNLPDSSITDGSQYFNAVTYTGDGSTSGNSITGVGFQPDFVWIKCRNVAEYHMLMDSVRGDSNVSGKYDTMSSALTNSEATWDATWFSNYGALTSLDSDGFTVVDGSHATSDSFNGSGDSYVAWNWRASDSTAVSNTDGTITSTVSANTTSGFSIVSYTGNGTAGATIGHGLGTAPELVIFKNRSAAQNWLVQGDIIGDTTAGNFLLLESTAAKASNNTVNTTLGASTITLDTSATYNGNGNNHIAYCFASVEGFSKFGSYTGNGSADGPFVYTGFKPAFVMVKNTSTAATNWCIHDTSRKTYNISDSMLLPNDSSAELVNSAYGIDILSNGFKIKNSNSNFNTSGNNYIYMAFAENPFKNSLAR